MITEQIPAKHGLSASTLKLIAVLAMFTDHTAYALLDFYTFPAQIMHVIGRLTIPIMCFFVAEGLRHTRSIRNYVLRMGAFWIISAIPFYMFFGDMYGIRQNIMLDLLIGLVTTATLADKQKKTPVKIAVTVVLMGISLGIGG
ncbi:MAG: TraX family protein, partial [Oscillospiraceae bacterium]